MVSQSVTAQSWLNQGRDVPPQSVVVFRCVSLLITLQSHICNRDHMFDRDLILDSRGQCCLALLSLSLLFERTQSLFQSPAFFSNSLAPFFEIIELDNAGLISVNQSLAFSLKAGHSSFEPLLFLLLRRSIIGFLALIILIDQDLWIPQQFAHGLPDELFNHFSARVFSM